ncbi:hypothetical protein [Streptomyces abikoensis]|uniref:hypothetical protein n=1 Tax=Streptomyces abikoensis TaxID=97398 RepID=UPI00167698B6|nr:hypothetical protein [Streptomyces abikoensis]GGP61103.1 hypothetical protein GCM10010214_38480 [Streptomyces abikoensis]
MRDLISRLLRRHRARGAVRTAPEPEPATPTPPPVLSLPHTSGIRYADDEHAVVNSQGRWGK